MRFDSFRFLCGISGDQSHVSWDCRDFGKILKRRLKKNMKIAVTMNLLLFLHGEPPQTTTTIPEKLGQLQQKTVKVLEPSKNTCL